MGFRDCLDVLVRDWAAELRFITSNEIFDEFRRLTDDHLRTECEHQVIGISSLEKLEKTDKLGTSNSSKIAKWLNSRLKSVKIEPHMLRAKDKNEFEDCLYSNLVLINKRLCFGEHYEDLSDRLPGIYIVYRYPFIHKNNAYRELMWIYKERGGFGFKAWYKFSNFEEICRSYTQGSLELLGRSLLFKGRTHSDEPNNTEKRFRTYSIHLDARDYSDSRLDSAWIGLLSSFTRTNDGNEGDPCTASFIMLKAYDADQFTEQQIRAAASNIVKFGDIDKLDDFQKDVGDSNKNVIANWCLKMFISNKLYVSTRDEIDKYPNSPELHDVIRRDFVVGPDETILRTHTSRFKKNAGYLLDCWSKPTITTGKSKINSDPSGTTFSQDRNTPDTN